MYERRCDQRSSILSRPRCRRTGECLTSSRIEPWFLALLEHEQSGHPTTGNPGLAPEGSPPPGWAGFRLLSVAGKRRESRSVVSFDLEPADGRPLVVPLPGQFVVLLLRLE